MEKRVILFLIMFLLLPLIYAESTFFDSDENFIIGDSTMGGVIGGTMGETTSGGGCLTNWSCSSWTSCVNGIQTRNCTKEKAYCYTDLKKKPAENQSCSIKTEIKIIWGSKEGERIFLIIILVFMVILAIEFIIFLSFKKHKKRKYYRHRY